MTLYRYPDWLPAEPATDRQVERAKELADEIGEEAVNYLQARIHDGLDQNAAWRLIGQLGVRVSAARKAGAQESERPAL